MHKIILYITAIKQSITSHNAMPHAYAILWLAIVESKIKLTCNYNYSVIAHCSSFVILLHHNFSILVILFNWWKCNNHMFVHVMKVRYETLDIH